MTQQSTESSKRFLLATIAVAKKNRHTIVPYLMDNKLFGLFRKAQKISSSLLNIC